jgi:hypothetical protein
LKNPSVLKHIIIIILYKVFQNIKEHGILSYSFCKTSIALAVKVDNSVTTEICRQIPLLDIDIEINTLFQQCIRRIHMTVIWILCYRLEAVSIFFKAINIIYHILKKTISASQ